MIPSVGSPCVCARPIPLNVLLGISLKLISALAFAAMSVVIKVLSADFPTGQMVFCRSAFALLPLLAWLASRSELIDAFRTRNLGGHIRRSAMGVMAMSSGFASLALIPLADATAIGYASPLIATALAALMLGETVRVYRWSALLVGFCGMIVMMWPYLTAGGSGLPKPGSAAAGALLALAGAAFGAFATIEVRRLSQSEKTGAIVFYFSATCALLSLITLAFGWRMPDAQQAGLLVLSGILGGVGQILLTASYRYAPVSVVAPFDYTSLLWALVLGFAIFGDIPAPLVMVGAAMVVAAGLFVLWREHRLGLRARQEREAAPQRTT